MATSQGWEKFIILEDISPLVRKNDLELYFKKLGLEQVCFIHNPRNGSFMRKALILVDSRSSAERIINKIHEICTDKIFEGETGMVETVTAVKCTGSVKIYTHGLYKLYLEVKLPWRQDSGDRITSMGLHLTRELVRAFRGLIVTTMTLEKDKRQKYTGCAILRFEHKSDKDEVLGRTKDILEAVDYSWTDAEDEDYWDKQPGAGVSEKVECDKVGDVSDVQSCGHKVMIRKNKKLHVPAMWRDTENENMWGTEVAEGPSEKIEGDNILDVELHEEGGNPDAEGEEEGVYQNVEGGEVGDNLGDEADEEGSFDSDGDW